MKFSITIDGDTTDAQSVSVLSLLASIAGGTVPNIPAFQPQPGAAAPTQPQAVTGTADADDEGAVNANAPAVDTAGLPWDERIHAKTKATIADGTWRKRRGVNDMLVQQVEAELRARIAAQPAAVQQPQPVAAAPLPDPAAIAAANAASGVQQPQPVHVATAPTPQPMPSQPQNMPDPSQIAAQQQQQPAPVQQPMPAAAAPAGELTFATFMQAVSGAMQAGKIDAQYLANIAAQHGITAVTAVSTDPAKMLTIYQQMQIEGKI